jgi:catechol 2,3-dioxygenase-like lactoylglutathione lyase family enzyme
VSVFSGAYSGGNNDLVAVIRVDHVQLAIPEGGEDRARGFYRDLLGVPEVEKPAHLAKRGVCWFKRGALKMHLGVDPDFRSAQKAHPGLEVRGLGALVARLEKAGFPVRPDEPLGGSGGCMGMIRLGIGSSSSRRGEGLPRPVEVVSYR